jgi:hypothetical protein
MPLLYSWTVTAGNAPVGVHTGKFGICGCDSVIPSLVVMANCYHVFAVFAYPCSLICACTLNTINCAAKHRRHCLLWDTYAFDVVEH